MDAEDKDDAERYRAPALDKGLDILELLAEQNVHEVVLLGRRDQASAAYTAAEYRALSEIPGVEVEVIQGGQPAYPLLIGVE